MHNTIIRFWESDVSDDEMHCIQCGEGEQGEAIKHPAAIALFWSIVGINVLRGLS